MSQTAPKLLHVGYASVTTVRAAHSLGEQEHFAPKMLVMFDHGNGGNRVLAATNEVGVAYVPLETGTWCISAYGADGRAIPLAKYSMAASHRCFRVMPGQAIEVSVTIAADARYSSDYPSLGVK
jgi:hypothetical protein